MTQPDDLESTSSKYRQVVRVGAFVALGLGLGALAGVLWELVVDLPVYKIASDGGASTTERGLTEFFAGDAWFAAIGLPLGLGLGVLGWRRFPDLGWPLVLVVGLTALGAGLLCWMVGYRLGPGDFTPRLAAAQAGDVVPIELTLRARASLLAWPFFAVIPILLGSSLGHDDEEPKPIFRRSAPPAGGRQPED
jgi:hypothetical protein